MSDDVRQPLSPEVVAQTRASLARIDTSAREAEQLVGRLMQLPVVQRSMELRRAGATPARCANPALDLLSLPAEEWHARLVALTPRQQRKALQRIVAASAALACNEPHRAHRLTGSILQIVRHDRLPQRATFVRHQLAGRALLVRARALITLHAYADALTAIAEARAALPRGDSYDRYRMHAQLLRGQVLAATGHASDALQTFTVCAQFAIDQIDAHALVDALASTAVLLCAHSEYGTALTAIALATRVARSAGNETLLATLQASLVECAFLTARSSMHDPSGDRIREAHGPCECVGPHAFECPWAS